MRGWGWTEVGARCAFQNTEGVALPLSLLSMGDYSLILSMGKVKEHSVLVEDTHADVYLGDGNGEITEVKKTMVIRPRDRDRDYVVISWVMSLLDFRRWVRE